MTEHMALFTWGAGPEAVFIAGNFNNWSDSATPLKKKDDGSFEAKIPLPWGQKQAFKYVVDGDWKVREDEAKEWDAAGNMNNVYTAPPAPLASDTEVPSTATAVPPPTAPDSAPAESSVSKTEPSTLVAASAPTLGAPSTSSTTAATTTAVDGETKTDPEVLKNAAANANIGEAPPDGQEEKTVYEKAAEYSGVALASLGAVVGTAAVAVEKVTGVDLTHGDPISIAEAEAQGIDVDNLEKVDAETDATSPAGTQVPKEAVEALDEKLKDLKVESADQTAVPLPNGEVPKTSTAPASVIDPTVLDNKEKDEPTPDIPAQSDTSNHQTIPATVITPVSPPDPLKDRNATAPTDPDAAAPVVSSVPSTPEIVDTKEKESAAASAPAPPVPVPEETVAAPSAVAVTPLPATATTTSGTAQVVATSIDKKVPSQPPATPAKDVVSPPPPAAATPGSVASTPVSTPAKDSSHARDTTTSTATSDVKKRKSGFFGKIKNAFSPAKEKN